MGRWVGLMTLVLVAASTTVSFGQPGAGRASSNGVMMADFGAAGADSLKGSKTCLVRVVSVDGKTVTGTLRLTTAVIGSSLGIYEIKPREGPGDPPRPPPRWRLLVGDPGESGRPKAGQVVTSGGEVIEGVVLLPKWWRVETDLGTLTPNIVIPQVDHLPQEERAHPIAGGRTGADPGPSGCRRRLQGRARSGRLPLSGPPPRVPDEALPPPGSLPTPAPSN